MSYTNWIPSPTNPEIMITVTHPDDPAHMLLNDDFTTTPTVYAQHCYICNDPEFAQMGLPLCTACPCGGHIAADDVSCDDCGEAFAYEDAMKEFGDDNV